MDSPSTSSPRYQPTTAPPTQKVSLKGTCQKLAPKSTDVADFPDHLLDTIIAQNKVLQHYADSLHYTKATVPTRYEESFQRFISAQLHTIVELCNS